MKKNVSIQLSAGTDWKSTEQDLFPRIDMKNAISGYENKFLTATNFFGTVSQIKAINISEKELIPFFNIPLKQVAARLSEIELALDCYDVSDLRVYTRDLSDLFPDKRMPAVCKLAVQMEELAKENQKQEVKDLLREIKKIVGRIVKHRMQPGD